MGRGNTAVSAGGYCNRENAAAGPAGIPELRRKRPSLLQEGVSWAIKLGRVLCVCAQPFGGGAGYMLAQAEGQSLVGGKELNEGLK